MSAKSEKIAADVVALARRKAAAREAVQVLLKQAKKAPLGEGSRFAAVERSARASGARDPAAVAASVGRKKHGKKRMAQLSAKGRKEAAFGSSCDEKSKMIKPKVAQPKVPAPARMKNEPRKPGMEVSANLLMAGLFVKAAEDTKRARADAYKTAAADYLRAVKSGDHAIVERAIVKLASVATFDTMTKQAIATRLGSILMRIIGKLSGLPSKLAPSIGSKGFTDWAGRAGEWGKGLGTTGKNVGALSKLDPKMLKEVLGTSPSAATDMGLARSIGTGTLAGLGGLYLGSD